MFDNINFYNHNGNHNSIEVLKSSEYIELEKEYALDKINSNSEFNITGDINFLLPTPISAEKADCLMYLQSFCYISTNRSYYTRRSDYNSILILYTYEGEGILNYCGKEYILKPGHGFIINCQYPHEYRCGNHKWTHSDLHFYGKQAQLFYNDNFEGKSPVFYCKKPDVFQSSLENILEKHQSHMYNSDFYVSYELSKLLFNLLPWMIDYKESTEIAPAIKKLKIYLEEHFTEDISLDDMSEHVGISKYHLCRSFKKVTGYSPKEYIIHLRISQAKILLESTNLPSYKIGFLTGFQNEANFIMHFKKITNMTPGNYRFSFGVKK